jgi:large subunit ribosomal protein L35
MPKLKTKRGAAKRFKRTANGKIKLKRAYKSHIQTKMSPKRVRQLRKGGYVSKANQKQVERMIPY